MQRLTMTRAEREAFLAATHVGILAVAEPGRGPCAVPVWYRYAPGEPVRINMQQDSRKARLLRAAGRASLCAQTETLPYRYVTVEGPIELVDGDVAADEREMAVRYLGPKLGDAYLASVAGDLPTSVQCRLRPERWWSVDFGKQRRG